MPPKPFCLQIDSQKRTRANDQVGIENGRGVVRRRRKGRGRGKGEREKERDIYREGERQRDREREVRIWGDS